MGMTRSVWQQRMHCQRVTMIGTSSCSGAQLLNDGFFPEAPHLEHHPDEGSDAEVDSEGPDAEIDSEEGSEDNFSSSDEDMSAEHLETDPEEFHVEAC